MWTVKWQQTHSYQQLKLKKNKNELSKQLEQQQTQRNGHHMEGYQQGVGRGRIGEQYRE